jgi:putative YphP/YqiW family bacilliredoxin
MYDPAMTQPMEMELTSMGIRALKSRSDVDSFLSDQSGTALVIINSVCGCAAGGARPGVRLALDHKTKPDKIATVFAGVDREAVDAARRNAPDFPPTSPSFLFFKDGKVVDYTPRHQIEGKTPEQVARELKAKFDSLSGTATAGA